MSIINFYPIETIPSKETILFRLKLYGVTNRIYIYCPYLFTYHKLRETNDVNKKCVTLNVYNKNINAKAVSKTKINIYQL